MTVELFARTIAIATHEGPLALEDGDAEDEELEHLHGEVEFVIEGTRLPSMGFFGPEDVCYDTWVAELHAVRTAFRAGNAQHVFDEGEQGQPAFVFEREGDSVHVSITASHIGGGAANPEWQRVRCEAVAFVGAIERFFAALRERTSASAYGRRWWKEVVARRGIS